MKEERIKEQSCLINRFCDILDKAIEKPILKEGLDEKELMKMNQFVARVAEHWADFKSLLKSHPEIEEQPWAVDFITAVIRLKKTMRKFDELGMTEEEISLKRKFFRQVYMTETLIRVYERIVTGQRKPVTGQEKRVLDNINNRVLKDLESTKFDPIFGTGDRWADGIISQQSQILSCIKSIQGA